MSATEGRWQEILEIPLGFVVILSIFGILALIGHANAESAFNETSLTEVVTWRDPSGGGSDLSFDFSSDGSLILLNGYGSPDEVRVVDRDLGTVAVLELPGPMPFVKGALWSATDAWVVVWGRVDGSDRDFLAAYDGSTFERTRDVVNGISFPLETIDALGFYSQDQILVVGGRDEMGTSRLLIVETGPRNVIRDHPWDGNETIVAIEADHDMRAMCVDEAGVVTAVSASSWHVEARFDAPARDPTAVSQMWGTTGYPQTVGYANGTVGLWVGEPMAPLAVVRFGVGPIDGVAWVLGDIDKYWALGVARPGGGTRISVRYWQPLTTSAPLSSKAINTTARVTMFQHDTMFGGQFGAGFEDGSFRLYNVSLIADVPPVVTITYPKDGQTVNGIVEFRGTAFDDHGNISSLQIQVFGKQWIDIPVSGEWNISYDLDEVGSGMDNVLVRAYDGRNWSEEARITIRVRHPSEGLSNWGGNDTIIVIVVVVTAIYLVLRLRRSSS